MKLSRTWIVAVSATLLVGFLYSQLTPSPIPPNPGGVVNGLIGGDPRTPISSLPFTINRCGSYVLTRCLTGAPGQIGIAISSSNVTIDLNGFTLDGNNAGSTGIHIGGFSHVRISNGNINGWTEHGVFASSSVDCVYSDLNISNNGLNALEGGVRSAIVACIASNNGAAGLSVQDFGSVTQCKAFQNASFGIQCIQGGIVSQSIAWNNQGVGINTSSGVIVDRCVAWGNLSDGIVGAFNASITVIASRAVGNTGDGIRAGDGGVIHSSDAMANSGIGISVSDAAVINCSSTSNSGSAIVNPNGLTVENNT